MKHFYELTLTLNCLVSAYMFGLIWFVQVLQYPQFLNIRPEKFVEFHQQHTFWMGILVGPAMLIEFFAGFFLILNSLNFLNSLNLCIVLGTWTLTFLISVPLHNRLAKGFDRNAILRLVATNWPRSFLWSLKFSLAVYAVLFESRPFIDK
jgi:hypothetical protein